MISPTPVEHSLVDAVVGLARALRERGVPATPAEAIDAARALEVVDLGDRDEVYVALRAVLVSRIEDYAVYDEVFHAFWRRRQGAAAPPAPRGEAARARPPERAATQTREALRQWADPDSAQGTPLALPAPSDVERRGSKDFSTYGEEELEEIRRVAASLVKRLVTRPSRRWEPGRQGQRVHPRRTLRRAFRTGGDVVELAYRKRKRKKTRLVVFCDVSGSMDLYSRFLIQFLYALQHGFARVETFVFSVRLSRITEQLRTLTFREALGKLEQDVEGWSGGTRIGGSLAQFLHEWPRLIDRRTIVIVLSDGWDTGEPALLAEALRTLRRQAGKLIWLNPLLGTPGYEPLTRGMQAALPHIDVFTSAHDLDSLRALLPHLTV